jgi:hypothetical protein
MLTKYELIIREWRKFVDEETSRLRDVLAAGIAIKSYEDYLRHVGRIEGLRTAIDHMAEAEKEVERNY